MSFAPEHSGWMVGNPEVMAQIALPKITSGLPVIRSLFIYGTVQSLTSYAAASWNSFGSLRDHGVPRCWRNGRSVQSPRHTTEPHRSRQGFQRTVLRTIR